LKIYFDRQKREEEGRRTMYNTLSEANPNWQEPYLKTLRHPPTKDFKKKLDGYMEQINALPATEDIDVAASIE